MSVKRNNITNLAAILLICGFLCGVDAFTYSNPFVRFANIYFKRKDYERSLELYKSAAGTVKDNAALNFNMAGAYYMSNDFENALKKFESSLKNDDRIFNSRVMFNMGNCYFKKGEFIKAYEKYKSALKLNPEDKKAKYNLEYSLSMIDGSGKSGKKKHEDKYENAKKRTGEIDGGEDPDEGGGNDNNGSADNADDGISGGDTKDFDDGLDDISPDEALGILNAFTQQVIVRKPMRKDYLTKKGGEDEKDW